MRGDGGPCGTTSSPGSLWFLCEDDLDGAPSPATTAPPSIAQLPVGEYACASEVTMFDPGEGIGYGAIADGTLTLTQTGPEVTAEYSGDAFVAGTLYLLATTATTASVEASQSLSASCTVPTSPGTASSLMPAPITAGSLAVAGSTLFLSFEGTMDTSSSCPGAWLAGSLICSKP